MTGEASSAVPGWYGKLPALGDFVSRRLPPEFVRTWDTWLQEGLGTTRAALGDGWLDCYLTAPIWRFVVLPGLVGSSGIKFEGPWALFRMFDGVQIADTRQSERFVATINVEGRRTVFEIFASSVRNPFRLPELSQFRCPTAL